MDILLQCLIAELILRLASQNDILGFVESHAFRHQYAGGNGSRLTYRAVRRNRAFGIGSPLSFSVSAGTAPCESVLDLHVPDQIPDGSLTGSKLGNVLP